MGLREDAEALADAREAARLAEEAYRERMQEPDIMALADTRRKAIGKMGDAESAVRAGIETAWAAAELEGDAPDLPNGLAIQWRTEVTYDGQEAIRYCKESFEAALRLDRHTFEHHARLLAELGKPLPFVSIGKKLTSTIATDLRAKLNADPDWTRADSEAAAKREQYAMRERTE